MAPETRPSVLPATPYRGIESFRYSDKPIFFARDDATRDLLRLVVVYRGILLYGESGAGKSSLVNAGLIPAAEAEGFDFRVDRIRVQPHLHHELVVERIAVTPDSASFLRSSFADDADGSQIVLSIDAFRAQLDKALSMKVRPLLIFDQFEELITLFEEARSEGRTDAREAQRRIVGMLVELLLHQTMPVKLVFSFREDYLAQVKELLALSPDLVNQSLRLTPPPTDALYEIIRDPFEKHPGHFGHELMPELAHRLSAELASRSPSGAINLSEMQIVCLRLWEASDPETLLEQGGVQAVLEDYLEESLNRFPQELHYPAIALLSQLVTSSGARNVVVRDDLSQRVRTEEPDIADEKLEDALEALEAETKLVRSERRGELQLYEISSEFLVPWIGRQREERVQARERAELERALEEKRQRQRASLVLRLGIVVSGLLLLSIALGLLALFFFIDAQDQRDEALSAKGALESIQILAQDPFSSLQTAVRAMNSAETPEAEGALRLALAQAPVALLAGHAGSVNSASFSRDGTRIVTAGVDGTARIWQVDQPSKLPVVVRADQRAVLDAAFDPSGTLVVTAGADGAVRLWRSNTGSKVATLLGHSGLVNEASFDSDGKRIVTAGADGTARIWEVNKPDKPRVFMGHDGALLDAAFSPDGTRVVTAGVDGTARIWQVDQPSKLPVVVRAHQGAVLDARFNPSGTLVFTAGADGVVRSWRSKTGSNVATLLGRSGFVNEASLSPDVTRLATAGEDGNGRIWELRSPHRAPIVLPGHSGEVLDVAFSDDGTLVVTTGTDETARVWKVDNTVAVLRSKRARILSAAFNASGTRVVTAGSDRTVRIWSVLRPGSAPIVVGHHKEALLDAAFSHDGTRVVTASIDGKARIWRVGVPNAAPILLEGHAGAVLGAEFDPGDTLVATAGTDGTARLWAPTGAKREVLLGHTNLVNATVFSPDGTHVLTASDDGTARIWDVTRPDARPVVLAGDSGPVISAAFDPGGTRVVTATTDGKARIWEVNESDDEPIVLSATRGGAIVGSAFSGNGDLVLTVGVNGTVLLWDADRPSDVPIVLARPTTTVLATGFYSDGSLVITATADGTARVYACDVCVSRPKELLALAAERGVG